MSEPLWRPSSGRVEQSNMTAFMAMVARDYGVEVPDYPALYDWSIAQPEDFWCALWDFADIVAECRGETVIERPSDPDNKEQMFGARFFPDARLNFAENLLRRAADDKSDALVFWGEDQVKRRVTHRELYDLVSRLAQAMRAMGLVAGDRVAGFMPNMPETVAAALAAASIGAVWSSCSPDFGVQGVLDRFGQIEPKILFVPDGYIYNGTALDSLARVAEFSAQLPTVEQIVVTPYIGDKPDLSVLDGGAPAALLADFIAPYSSADIEFAQLPFNHPLYIMFSSGTTGAPKCIVHGAGGTLLQHKKEHLLHMDEKPGERLFYFTTCGWMMWNWLISGLSVGATLLLYDGSPTAPTPRILFDMADAEGMTIFGTSAKFIDALSKRRFSPCETHDLSSLRAVASTGSPLAPEGFDYVYQRLKKDVHLASIAGGTDLLGCFVLGDPTGLVWRGEIQARGLGMKVEVFDPSGKPVRGEKGELVCSAPFPSMPVAFWGDADNAKYHAAYFEKFPGVWCHGDYVLLTEHDGMIIYGRSDATLNPGGVRIGTAEIYRQVERLDQVEEGLVIGQEWKNDTRVVLFVRLRDGLTLDSDLEKEIKTLIRENTTPRHVPSRIVQVADIPRTKSGKIVELAVRDVVHGRPVSNREALANPQALDLFVDIPALAR